MALGIHNDGIHTIYEIPLNSSNDKKWNDRSWLIEHLRLLADKLEETKFEVYIVGIEMDSQYKTPNLFIKGWEYKEEIYADMLDSLGHTTAGLTLPLSIFHGLTNKSKWEIFPNLTNIEWICPTCGNRTEKPKMVSAGGLFCRHCDALLTQHTNGGQNDPFNWVFRRNTEKI
jgi:hypothetical protein